jgi:hypothetical protein
MPSPELMSSNLTGFAANFPNGPTLAFLLKLAELSGHHEAKPKL